MPDEPDKPVAGSGRKGSTKVRTGCITCKIRRVKCDEEKPACLRCRKSGRTCDGYAGSRLKARLPPLTPSAGDHRIAAIPSGPAATAGWAPSELRAFAFFLEYSGTHLFADSSSSAAVWTSIIPTLCHQQPAIRHAVFVISHLHETCYRRRSSPSVSAVGPLPSSSGGSPPSEVSPFAAFHYSKALQALRDWEAPGGTLVGTVASAVPLLACALFVCIEFMLGDNNAAQMHMLQGRQLLLSYDDSGSKGTNISTPATDFLRDHVLPVFTRMTLSSLVIGSTPAALPTRLRVTATADDGPVRMPKRFPSADGAARALFEVCDDCTRFVYEARMYAHQDPGLDSLQALARGNSLERKQQCLKLALRQWHTAFQASPFPKDGITANLSLTYYHLAVIHRSISLTVAETAFDDFFYDFERIVHHSGKVLTGADGDDTFTFDMGIMLPLYVTCFKCRHAGIRRAALALLRQLAARGCRENSWDAVQIYSIAAFVVALEEAARTSVGTEGQGAEDPSDCNETYIPASARVKHALIGEQDAGGVWTVLFMQVGPGPRWGPVKEHIPLLAPERASGVTPRAGAEMATPRYAQSVGG